jgi:hypothetical protein
MKSTTLYVLLMKESSNDYLTSPGLETVGIETIGCKGSGHFSEDLTAVRKFDSKEAAWEFLSIMQSYDKSEFARKEWKVERYVMFEKRVLDAYLVRGVKQRDLSLSMAQV